MPPPVQPNTVWSATIEGILFGQQVMNTFHYQYRGDASAQHADVLAVLRQMVEGAQGILTVWKQVVSQDVKFIALRYQRIHPVRYAYLYVKPDEDVGLAGPCNNPILSAVITRQGELANRHNVSNIHIPGTPNEAIDEGYLTPGYVGLLLSLADESTSVGLVGQNNKLVPVALNRVNPAASEQVIVGYAQETVRSMQRRRVGQGS